MAEEDLKRFLNKVEQLQEMVRSLDHFPGRRELLVQCTDHNQVVDIARSWGYEIGRRWGDVEQDGLKITDENLLATPAPSEGQKDNFLIKEGKCWRLETFSSCSEVLQNDCWHAKDKHEWILVLRGSTRLKLKSPDVFVDM